MSYPRAIARISGMVQDARQGFGLLTDVAEAAQTTDSNQTLLAAQIAGGLYTRTMTAGRTDTTDTAANILAQWPEMDIGDTFLLAVSVLSAFAITWAAGTGVTLAGKTTAAASSFSMVAITKLSATTIQWKQL